MTGKEHGGQRVEERQREMVTQSEWEREREIEKKEERRSAKRDSSAAEEVETDSAVQTNLPALPKSFFS